MAAAPFMLLLSADFTVAGGSVLSICVMGGSIADVLAAIGLSHRLEKQAFLCRRDAEWLALGVAQDGDPFTFGEGLSFNDDRSMRYRSSSDLHVSHLTSCTRPPLE